MTNNDITNLSPEEMVQLLLNNLTECNKLISELGKKSALDQKELRKIKNNLMFTRTKARNLTKMLEDMKKPINAFKLSS